MLHANVISTFQSIAFDFWNISKQCRPICCLMLPNKRNVFARFDEIPSMTLKDNKETAYIKAIKNCKGK